MTKFELVDRDPLVTGRVKNELRAKSLDYWRDLFKNPELSQTQADAHVEHAIGSALTGEIWRNDTYQVIKRELPDHPVGMVHLSIKRIDRQPIHDWRELQKIKNELLGEECEALELYPSESRLVDCSNQFHLWAFTNPKIKATNLFGFQERLVTEATMVDSQQRPFA